jgi:hypothetical protein
MQPIRDNLKRAVARLGLVLTAGLGLFALGGSTACDPYGFDTIWPSYGANPWDWQTVQSVIDYRNQVFDNANDAWDEYILE